MSDNISPRKVGKFLKALNSNRKEIIELTFEEAAKRAKVDGDSTLFEVLEEDEYYIPYTDCDHYCKTIERPSEEEIESVRDKMFEKLLKLEGNQRNDEADYRFATRHGVDPKKKVFKLSFRCYFLGYVIKLADMRDIIVRKGLDKGGEGSLDKAPYSKNQLLCRLSQDRTRYESAAVLLPSERQRTAS